MFIDIKIEGKEIKYCFLSAVKLMQQICMKRFFC